MINKKLDPNLVSKKCSLSRGKIYLLISFVFLFLFLFPKSEFVLAGCIPQSQDVSGCSLNDTDTTSCEGSYHEHTYEPQDPSCNSNNPYKVWFYVCRCNFTERFYLCPGNKLRSTYSYTGATILSYYNCLPGFQPGDISKEIATNQQLCNQWCQPTAFQPSPTPILICPNSKVYCLSTSKVRVYWNSVPGAYSYRVYRDGIYKGQVTTNGYTDTGVSCGVQHLYNVNPFPSGGFERVCKQNTKIICACPTKILPPPK